MGTTQPDVGVENAFKNVFNQNAKLPLNCNAQACIQEIAFHSTVFHHPMCKW